MFLANFVQIEMVKLKKNRELGVFTLGIKRDGHNKKIRELEVPVIRRDDCIHKTCFFADLKFVQRTVLWITGKNLQPQHKQRSRERANFG